MQRIPYLTTSIVVAAILLALAPSGLGSSKPALRAEAQVTGAVPTKLVGKWGRNVTQADWARYGQSFPTGVYRFVVKKNGSVGVYFPGTAYVDFTTKFSVSGGRLTIDVVPICPVDKGRYTWKVAGKQLTLKVVADRNCKARAALFSGVWTKR